MLSHDLVFQADLFEVGGAVVVRANGPLVRDVNCWSSTRKFCENHKPTHELLDDHGTGFWREDLGIFVITPDLLRKTS